MTVQLDLLRHMAPLNDGDMKILQDFCLTHDAQLWLHGEGEVGGVIVRNVLHDHVDFNVGRA